MTSIWLRDLVAYALQVALIVTAAALLARLFRFGASSFTLVYWQGLLAVCLILPVCQRWKASPAGMAPKMTSSAATVKARVTAPSALPLAPRSVPQPIGPFVLAILVGGLAISGCRLAASWRGLARLKRDSQIPAVTLQPVLAAARELIGVGAEFRISESSPAPITFGLRRPVILLPANLGKMEPETQRAVVYHELLHVRRHDWISCVAEEFVRTLLWFHPAIWWLIERIHLTREQVVDQDVIRLTASREGYVAALVALAHAKLNARLIPAPLFLGRGLLKRRIAEILKETTMTTRRLILYLAVSALALFLVARAATSIFPLRTHAQELSGVPIQVVEGGENLVHRAALVYPRRAIERRVEGDVVLEVSVDDQGQISDARVVSGPEELRRACLQSVLEWRYQPSSAGPATRQVVVRFELPKDDSSPEIVLRPVPDEREDGAVRYFVMRDPQGAAAAEQQIKELEEASRNPGATAEERKDNQLRLDKLKADIVRSAEARETEELRAKISDAATPPEQRARLKKQLAEREAGLSGMPEGKMWFFAASEDQSEGPPKQEEAPVYFGPVSGKVTAIRTERVSQAALDALSSRLSVHVGDTINGETAEQVRETVRQTLGEQFRILFHPSVDGGVELVIVGP